MKRKHVFYVKRWNEKVLNEDSTPKGGEDELLNEDTNRTKDELKSSGSQTLEMIQASAPKFNEKNSAKLKYLIKNGLIPPDYIANMDLDRLKEDEEEFLGTDKRRILALERFRLQPLKSKKKTGEVI